MSMSLTLKFLVTVFIPFTGVQGLQLHQDNLTDSPLFSKELKTSRSYSRN